MRFKLFRQVLEKKNPEISNFMKIRPLEAELLQTDRHDEANTRFPQFCERA
jgi:hypothetical protein